jgi:gamma-glutamyl-gamma-aminobutyrate hydrolase PuuD
MNVRIGITSNYNAVESIDKTWQMGLQWHPECLADEYSAAIFKGLVIEAGKRA